MLLNAGGALLSFFLFQKFKVIACKVQREQYGFYHVAANGVKDLSFTVAISFILA